MTGEDRTSQPQAAPAPSRGKVVAATGIAFLTAVVVLVVAILPAEFGIDPLGIGSALGLLDLARAQPIAPQPGEYHLGLRGARAVPV